MLAIIQNNTLDTFSWFDFFITNFSNLTSLIEVILIGVYVFFTIKTFKEMKKQTDLQLKAYLNAEYSFINDKELTGDKIDLKVLKKNYSSDWKSIMEQTFPQLKNTDILNGNYYTIELTNYSNTEIKCIDLKCNIRIENSEKSISEKKLLPYENKEFITQITQILKKGETIKFPLFSTASYPKFSITTLIKYTDIRDQTYNLDTIQTKGNNSHLE